MNGTPLIGGVALSGDWPAAFQPIWTNTAATVAKGENLL